MNHPNGSVVVVVGGDRDRKKGLSFITVISVFERLIFHMRNPEKYPFYRQQRLQRNIRLDDETDLGKFYKLRNQGVKYRRS